MWSDGFLGSKGCIPVRTAGRLDDPPPETQVLSVCCVVFDPVVMVVVVIDEVAVGGSCSCASIGVGPGQYMTVLLGTSLLGSICLESSCMGN